MTLTVAQAPASATDPELAPGQPAGAEDADRLLRSTLDSLSAHVAVLDEAGTILFVNRAWTSFGERCGYSDNGAGVGSNYLAVCERSAPASEDARRTARALREIAAGRRRSFRLEYPCEGPDGPRWFQLRITRPEGMRRLVVAHEEITEVKIAQTELAELTGRLMRLQDEERRALARELHDTTAQNLFAVALNLTKTRERLRKGVNPREEELMEMLGLVEQSLQEVRTLSYVLHPPFLDAVGLSSALKWLASGFSERSGIRVDMAVEETSTEVGQDEATALFRVAQESLTNVHRHSGSAWARLSLARRGVSLCLEVVDGGRGFDPDATEGSFAPGVGLSGMRVRLAQLGGDLQIEAGPSGTRLRATVPLHGGASV